MFYPGDGRVVKFTHFGEFGLYPEFDPATRKPPTDSGLRVARATPAQYLERIVLTRDVFGDDLRFIGIAVDTDGDVSAVTTQPFIAGDAPDYEEVCVFMGDFGFHEVEKGNFFRPMDEIAVFDPWPRNFVKLGEDLLPIDIVPIHARGAVLEYEKRHCPV